MRRYRGQIDQNDLTGPPYQQNRKDFREKLSLTGVDPDHSIVVLINPNSSEIFLRGKWSLQYYPQFCSALLKKIAQCVLIVTALSSERADAEFIQVRFKADGI
jgi:hypothetical protein